MASAVILDMQKQETNVINGLVKFSSSQKGMLGQGEAEHLWEETGVGGWAQGRIEVKCI